MPIKISPKDMPEVQDWQDGKTYTIKVKQISPGVFEPVGASAKKDVMPPAPAPVSRYAKP